MPIILEWRHRLLHMRASLERNSGQSTFHWIYAGPSFNSRMRNQEGKTSWPQIWETSRRQRISSGPSLEKEMHQKGTSKESMIDSCEIMFSVNGWSKTVEMKMFVVHGTFLQNKITPIECQNQNTFTTGKIGWISLNKSGSNTQPVRKRSDFNQALSTLNRLHREAGGQQLRPMPYWKYQQRHQSSSSSSSWWQWRESWWSS